jgi:hypothetical protein
MHGHRRPRPAPEDQTRPATGGDDHRGQGELFAAPPRVRPLDALAEDWTRSPNGAALLSDLAGFAAAPDMRTALFSAVVSGGLVMPDAVMQYAYRERIPVTRQRSPS